MCFYLKLFFLLNGEKCKLTSPISTTVREQHKAICMEEKLDIISWLEKCELTTNVCCAFTRGVPEYVRIVKMCTSNEDDKFCTLLLF